ncbi:MAG: glycosyltransferase family 4 protein, partial [Hyphomicrobiales bacterium]|nr:glycosyltransferase family 4 protein [Hyphomicrobiales bacterium]
ALSELGHDVLIVVGSMASEAEYQRSLSPRLDLSIFPLSQTPLKGMASVAAWLRAKAAIDRFRPDLIIHNEAVPLPFRAPTVQLVHNLEPRSGPFAPLWRTIRRFTTRRSDYVIATTSELREALVSDLRMPASEIPILPKCVDLPAYCGADIASRERAILHSGTLAYKDAGATIGAFGALDDQSVQLYVVGAVTEPVREAVNALPERLRNRIALLGQTDAATLRALHGRVRVDAFPTRYAIPVASGTVMEAIAAGTPIVGSSQLSRDVLADGVNGIVVDTTPDAMAAGLRAALNDDPLWARLSDGARRMAGTFDAMRVARRYVELASADGSGETQATSRPARDAVERHDGADAAHRLPLHLG